MHEFQGVQSLSFNFLSLGDTLQTRLCHAGGGVPGSLGRPPGPQLAVMASWKAEESKINDVPHSSEELFWEGASLLQATSPK